MRQQMVKPAVFAVSGVVVGATAAYFVVKSKYRKISEEEIASLRQHYKMKEQELLLDKEDELEQIKQAHGLINHEDPREAFKIYKARLDEMQYMAEEEKTESEDQPLLSKVVDRDPSVRISYDKVAQNPDFEAAVKAVAEGTSPEELRVVDEPVEEDEEADDEKLRQNIFEASVRSDVMNGGEDEHPSAPYVIPVEIFQEESDIYEKVSISYYEDGTLADERNMPIPDPDPIVGDENLERFGEGSQDDNIVYVRNERIHMDFEISREIGSYAESFMKSKDWSDDGDNDTWKTKNKNKRNREDG